MKSMNLFNLQLRIKLDSFKRWNGFQILIEVNVRERSETLERPRKYSPHTCFLSKSKDQDCSDNFHAWDLLRLWGKSVNCGMSCLTMTSNHTRTYQLKIRLGILKSKNLLWEIDLWCRQKRVLLKLIWPIQIVHLDKLT